MAPSIEVSKVFDPATENDEHNKFDFREPVRLHLGLAGMPEAPTHVELDVGPFSVMHYSRYMKIFSDLPEWDDEAPASCAARFNNQFVTNDREPVIPVTVIDIDNGATYSDYYVKVSHARAMLRHMKSYYECLPIVKSALEKSHAWEFIDTTYQCVICGRDGEPISTALRTVPLCATHNAHWGAHMKAERMQETS